MNGISAIADILRREGTEYLFVFPYHHLIEPAVEQGIRPILARTERTVVAMADGYSRVTDGRKLGVVAVQEGPGSENSFGGVAQAYADGTPLLVLPGGAHQERIGQDPVFDGVKNYAGITKWSARITHADRVPQLLRRAFTYLRMGRPGPVLLEIPNDVALADADAALVRAYRPVPRVRAAADPEAVAAAASALLSAKTPLIHAGQGVLYAGATDELRELAELLGAAVMSTLQSKSVFPENHPLSAGSGGLAGQKAAATMLKEADVILGIGASFTISSFAAPIPNAGAKTLIQVLNDERDMNKDYQVAHPILGDAKLALRQLIDEIKRQAGPSGPRPRAGLADQIAALKADTLARFRHKLGADETPMNPYRVIWDLLHSVDPAQTVITHDSGNPRDQLSPFWEATAPRGYLGWGKSTHLGYGLGLIMGAKLGAPDKLCINVLGDAAFGMTGMEVETAARCRIPILTILLNNSAMGGYGKYHPMATEQYGFKYLSGDYTAVAKGLGAHSERVEAPADIKPAIARAQAAIADGRPALLEMITREEPDFEKHW
jgi:acetolactate synthase I/II/III large subunit